MELDDFLSSYCYFMHNMYYYVLILNVIFVAPERSVQAMQPPLNLMTLLLQRSFFLST